MQIGLAVAVPGYGEHVAINLLEVFPVFFDRSAKKVNDGRHACAGIGKRLIVLKRKAVEILEKLEDDLTSFRRIRQGSFQFQSSALQFRIGEDLGVQALVAQA